MSEKKNENEEVKDKLNAENEANETKENADSTAKEEVKEEAHEHEHEHKHEHGGHTCCGKHGHKHEEETKKLKAEIETLKNDYLRKQAEFQNFTKRKMNEVEELKKFASEKIITQLLGSLDNFERAIEASNESKDFDSLLQGVEMIVRNLKDIMTGEGVEEISTEGAFNPEYHHAVGVEACEDKNEDEIKYILKEDSIVLFSGIIEDKLAEVISKAESVGLEVAEVKEDKEWRSCRLLVKK